MANQTAFRGALLVALTAISPALARSVEYRWAGGSAMGGTLSASIENAAGSVFRIECEAGAVSSQGKGGFAYQTKRTPLREDERVQVVVGKRSFLLRRNSRNSLTALGSRIELSRLVDEMIKTRAKFFLVEVPRTKFAEQFSLKDAETHLKLSDGNSIYEPCL